MPKNDMILPAIDPTFKSLRLRKFRTENGYTPGVKLVNKVDVGVVFPFERDHSSIMDGVKTILGNTYGNKVFCYWVPRRYRIKENIFSRKFVRHDNKIAIDLKETLPLLKMNKSTFLRTYNRNYIYDFSSILEQLFPAFDDIAKWGNQRALMYCEEFIKEYLTFILSDTNINGSIIESNTFMNGSGIKTTHDKLLIGIKVRSGDSIISRYADPSVAIPRQAKDNLEELIPVFIIRALIAGRIGYKEDKLLLDIFNLIKDASIVFYNVKGVGFIYNSDNDAIVQTYEGATGMSRIRDLYKLVVRLNVEDFDEVGLGTDSYDETVADKLEPLQGSAVADAGFEDIAKLMLNSNKVDEASAIQFAQLSKLSKDDGDDSNNDDLNTVFSEGEEEDEKPEESIDDLDNISDDIEIEEDEIDEGMLVDEDGEGPVQTGTDGGEVATDPTEDGEIEDTEMRELVSSISRDSKPKLTPAQVRRREFNRNKYKSIMVDGRTIEQIISDTKATAMELTTPNITVMDNSIKSSRLVAFETSYIDNTMEYDLMNTIKSFSDGNKSIGLHITDVEKVDTSDQSTNKYTYTFKLVDDNDRRHTIRVDIPKIDKDGFLMIGGNKKILKKQLTLLPVVKMKPDMVMISSNYNKCFIFRHGTVITRNISAIMKLLGKHLVDNPKFKIYHGDNSKENTSVITNIEYDILAAKYHRFVVGTSRGHRSEYIFNQKEIRQLIKDHKFNYKFRVDRLPVGLDWKNRTVIDIDLHDTKDGVCDKIFQDIVNYEVVANFNSVLNSIPITKRRMYTRIELQSRDYALIAFLGALYGLSKVMNVEKMKTQFSEKRINGDPRVYIEFSDGFLYYDDSSASSSLLLNGLAYMNSKDYQFADFDTERPYIQYFYEVAKSRNVYKGHTAFKELFIDNITYEILRDLKLPTDFLELFLYANTLLSDNTYTTETSLENYRIRGYENISVILYKSLSAQYRLYKQSSTGTGRISIQQDQVMVGLHKSFILENYDSTNPVNELKSKSIVTFKGPGGINNDRVFTLEKRSYDFSAIGTIAVSSVTSGAVGITKQITTNPNITSTRGYIDVCRSKDVAKKLKLGDMASPEEADVAFTNAHDDPKRIGFISTQTKHVIKVKGASFPVISTGMDKSSPYMVGHTYVPKARKDGVITKIEPNHNLMTIKYNDGTTEAIIIGRTVQRNSSFYFPNNILPNVKEGQKVKKGEILGYESDFYKKDVFGNIRSSQSVLAKLVIHEKSVTDDDSSMITDAFANKMVTDVVKRKQIVLTPDANVMSYKRVGDYVTKGDPILVFEDSGDEQTNMLMDSLGDISTDVLAMARQTPKANATGEIVEIKVYYTKPIEEMSDSIKAFVHDWAKSARAKQKIEKSVGVVNHETEMLMKVSQPQQAGADKRINGAIIPDDGGILIEYYIGHEQGMGVGDKLTFGGHVKSVVAQVLPKGAEPVTEDGVLLDGIMGSFSLSARMVMSPLMTGVLTHALVETSKKIAREYLGINDKENAI